MIGELSIILVFRGIMHSTKNNIDVYYIICFFEKINISVIYIITE